MTCRVPDFAVTRIQYLPGGRFILAAIKSPGKNADQEYFKQGLHWMAENGGEVTSFGEDLFGGVAVSRQSNHIAWGAPNPPGTPVALDMPGTAIIHAGTIDIQDGRERLFHERTVYSGPQGAWVEVQDFLPRDLGLIHSKYRDPGEKTGQCNGKAPPSCISV